MIDIDLQLTKQHFELNTKFSVSATGVTGIFGHSGSGKTSLLRAIAGLESSASGHVRIGEDCWQDQGMFKAVECRRVGVVFQQADLFPHLSVAENLQYASKRSKESSQAIEFDDVIDLLQLQNLLARRDTGKLSGGEQQRVAIGRALLASPRMLLMDEPLSALDHSARRELMSFLDKTFQALEIPVFYVSHSSEEIARLADNLVLMQQGRATAYGKMTEVLGQVDSPLNELDEAFSVFDCTIEAHDLPHLTSLKSRGGELVYIPRVDSPLHSKVRLRILARDVSLCLERPDKSSILNILQGQVIDISATIEKGSRTIKVDIGGESLLARVSEYSAQQLGLQPGLKLFAQIKFAALIA